MRFYTELVTEFLPESGRRRLLRPLIAIDPDDPCLTIIAPCGFETDFASIPKRLRGWIDNDESWLVRPAVLHDWLYSEGRLPRARCDRILYRAALAEGAPRLAAWTVWAAVRLFGSTYYRS